MLDTHKSACKPAEAKIPPVPDYFSKCSLKNWIVLR